MEVVDGERDDDDEGQDEAQDEGEGLLQTLPLVGDALVGCENKKNTVSMLTEHDWQESKRPEIEILIPFKWSYVFIIWSQIIIVGLPVGLFF